MPHDPDLSGFGTWSATSGRDRDRGPAVVPPARGRQRGRAARRSAPLAPAGRARARRRRGRTRTHRRAHGVPRTARADRGPGPLAPRGRHGDPRRPSDRRDRRALGRGPAGLSLGAWRAAPRRGRWRGRLAADRRRRGGRRPCSSASCACRSRARAGSRPTRSRADANPPSSTMPRPRTGTSGRSPGRSKIPAPRSSTTTTGRWPGSTAGPASSRGCSHGSWRWPRPRPASWCSTRGGVPRHGADGRCGWGSSSRAARRPARIDLDAALGRTKPGTYVTPRLRLSAGHAGTVALYDELAGSRHPRLRAGLGCASSAGSRHPRGPRSWAVSCPSRTASG